MTKKHYELIAEAFKNSRSLILEGENKPSTAYEELLLKGWETTARVMATQLSKTNLKFDRARFLEACGVEA